MPSILLLPVTSQTDRIDAGEFVLGRQHPIKGVLRPPRDAAEQHKPLQNECTRPGLSSLQELFSLDKPGKAILTVLRQSEVVWLRLDLHS